MDFVLLVGILWLVCHILKLFCQEDDDDDNAPDEQLYDETRSNDKKKTKKDERTLVENNCMRHEVEHPAPHLTTTFVTTLKPSEDQSVGSKPRKLVTRDPAQTNPDAIHQDQSQLYCPGSTITRSYEENYLIFITELGTGCYGQVQLFEDTYRNRMVVKKSMPSTVCSQKIAYYEISRLLTLSGESPFLEIYGYYYHPSRGYVVFMEYFHGHTLDSYFARNRVTHAMLVEILLQVVKGLRLVHKKCICIRALTGSNIIVDDNRQVKLIEFGLAKTGLTATGFVGEVGYVAPEIMAHYFRASAPPYGKSCDFYSLGAILFRNMFDTFPGYSSASVLSPPVEESEYWNFMYSGLPISEDGLKFPKRIDPMLEDLLHGLLNSDPKTRLSSRRIKYHPYLLVHSRDVSDVRKEIPVAVQPRPPVSPPRAPRMDNKWGVEFNALLRDFDHPKLDVPGMGDGHHSLARGTPSHVYTSLAITVIENALERPGKSGWINFVPDKSLAEQGLIIPETLDILLKDLLARILEKDPSRRPTDEDILNHSFFSGTTDEVCTTETDSALPQNETTVNVVEETPESVIDDGSLSPSAEIKQIVRGRKGSILGSMDATASEKVHFTGHFNGYVSPGTPFEGNSLSRSYFVASGSRYDVTITLMLLCTTSLTMGSVCQISQTIGSSIRLAHEQAAVDPATENGVPVIMLHGITDVKETWDDIYRKLPSLILRRVYIYDARNHGDSEWDNAFSIEVLAEDLGNFMSTMNIEKAALVGHSMGGLTAMKFALTNPDKVEKLLLEDISPYLPKDVLQASASFLKILADLDSRIPDDADEEAAKDSVIQHIVEITKGPPPIHLFKKFPLCRRDGKWKWKSNYEAFVKAFENTDSFFGTYEGQYDGKTLFIYGTESLFKVGDRKDDIKKLFPKAEFVAVEGADHLVHAVYPEFQKELIEFLK